jgi:hypothetical protein
MIRGGRHGIAFNCHESSVAATEIDIRSLPRTELLTGLLKYGIPLTRFSLTGRGVSRGVLRVLQHPPTQLNNTSQHKKTTTCLANSEVIMGRGRGWSCQLKSHSACV